MSSEPVSDDFYPIYATMEAKFVQGIVITEIKESFGCQIVYLCLGGFE
jgi:hypothetical protein